MTTHRSDDRGQVLVMTAFALFGLLAVAALVLDLGFSWMLRRQEQNAADPAAIAAARYILEATGPGDPVVQAKMDDVACFYAQENGFFTGDSDCTNAMATADLEVLWPPSGPHADEFSGRPEMVLVVIHAEHPLFFGRIFGQSTAFVATGAIAARETSSANSNSLVALRPDGCDSGKTHGNGDIVIEPVENPETEEPFSGGYVHVNDACAGGTFDNACGSGSGGFHLGGNAGASLTAPHLYVHGTCQASGGSLTTPVTEGATPIGDPLSQLIGPRQEDYPAGFCPKKQGNQIVYVASTPTSVGCSWNTKDTTVTLTPGVYWGGWNFSGQNVTVKLLPGIYIIAGGGLTITGSAEIDSTPDAIGGDPDPSAYPARVLIFSTDNTMDPDCATSTLARCIQGQIKMSGQSSLRMWGLTSGPWRGLLMWQDRLGRNPAAPIELVGQGVLDLAGTIYAPLADVKITGNGEGSGTLAVQVISWTWDIGGNGELYMPYDPNKLYQLQQRGLVH